MKKVKKRGRVVMAMSGGIDSNVAAALLKEADFDVIGVFMKLDKLKSSNEEEKRARTVAKKLAISFQVLDLRKEFKEKVIKYFIEEHKKGRTPNPCVICNKKIKFGLLYKKAMSLGADYIATGHYARIKINKAFKLLKGKDEDKDQSYFLWRLDQKALKRILFPVGGYTKNEVKNLAKEFKSPVLNIPESQEICFIQTTVSNFLKKYLKRKTGKIIDVKGKIIGEHQGLWAYTIGQRKGIKLAGGPFYVLGKNLKKNLLIVTKKEKDLYKKELVAEDINWISGKPPKFPLKIKAKIRYRHKPALVTISKQNNGKIKVIFSKPQRAITSGQSVVFYRNKELVGGGVIC